MSDSPLYGKAPPKPKSAEVAPQPETDPNKVPHFFHLVAANTVFEKGGIIKTRQLNLLLETDGPNIRQPDLTQANMGILSRLMSENDIQETDLKDIIILGISRLGHMPREVFYNIPAEELAAMHAEAEAEAEEDAA